MSDFSRRQFLKQICAITGLLVASRNVISSPSVRFSEEENTSFEMLVIGDSLIWGQGLEEKDKFYTLTKTWLEDEVFSKSRKLSLNVKAHSGATIFLHEKETAILKKAGKEETSAVIPEISLAFPTLKRQIEAAKNDYETAGKSANDVNLVMLSGGLVDISVAGILNPFGDDNVLRKDIVKYCGEDMFRFLQSATNVFPNAKFAVIGYFPMLSPKTPPNKLLNNLLEALDFPLASKPFLNNILTRPFFIPIRKKALRRSRIWFEDSNRELQTAVNRVNEESKSQRVIFIKAPLTEENALETKNTLLFKMGRRGKVEDTFYDQRHSECQPQLAKLKKDFGLKLPVRQCEIAGLGHPNINGAKAYAEAIKENLRSIFAAQ